MSIFSFLSFKNVGTSHSEELENIFSKDLLRDLIDLSSTMILFYSKNRG